jgi:transposase
MAELWIFGGGYRTWRRAGESATYGPITRWTYEQDTRRCGRQWLAGTPWPHGGEAYDNRLCSALLTGLRPRTLLLADRGYYADWIRALAICQGAWANIPPKQSQGSDLLQPLPLRARNLVERFFNKSSSAGVSLRATTSSQPTTLPS